MSTAAVTPLVSPPLATNNTIDVNIPSASTNISVPILNDVPSVSTEGVDSNVRPAMIPNISPSDYNVPNGYLPLNIHLMETRGMFGIFKKKVFIASIPSVDTEPTSFSKASKSIIWQKATLDEYQALMKQHTWFRQPFPPGKNAIECRWVFRVKKNPDGSIFRHKARLVAKGYHREEGLDYDETFSLVVKKPIV